MVHVHIIIKLADKVSKELLADESFKKELNSCVWSELIEPNVFEEQWPDIMVRFDLVTEPWFQTMFECRHRWVPAYFRDFPMSGLLKTTSISESENSFFKRYTHCRSNLLQFWMSYNNALESQRHTNAKLNYLDKSSVPAISTNIVFEKDATVYLTTKMFTRVKAEIVACCYDIEILETCDTGNTKKFKISDELDNVVNVVHNKIEETFECECKLFVRMGILCRYVFIVFKNNRMKHIPEKYNMGRWQKNPHLKPVHAILGDDVQQYSSIDEKQRQLNRFMSSMFGWIQRLDGDAVKMARFIDAVDDAGKCITGDDKPLSAVDKNKLFEEFYGASVPEKVDVLPPKVVKTKGSGSRIISRREKAARLVEKSLRRCNKCKEMATHDARNCGKKK